MDLKRDLEEYKKTCKMHGDATMVEMDQELNFENDKDNTKEIIVSDFDLCRYKLEYISVRDIPSEAEASVSQLDAETSQIQNGNSDSTIVNKNNVAAQTNNRNSSKKTSNQPEFSKDKEVPNRDSSTMVYDFALSKENTLPHHFLSPEEVRSFRRKWICISGLIVSTAVLIIIVTLVLALN